MKLLIDIDENLYTRLFDNGDIDAMDMLKACVAIRKGMPLPKGRGDLISRQAVIDGINVYIEKAQSTGSIDDFISFEELVVKALPSAEKTAEWEWVQYESLPDFGNYHCSECRHIEHEIDGYNYCPNCGAKMKESEEK